MVVKITTIISEGHYHFIVMFTSAPQISPLSFYSVHFYLLQKAIANDNYGENENVDASLFAILENVSLDDVLALILDDDFGLSEVEISGEKGESISSYLEKRRVDPEALLSLGRT